MTSLAQLLQLVPAARLLQGSAPLQAAARFVRCARTGPPLGLPAVAWGLHMDHKQQLTQQLGRLPAAGKHEHLLGRDQSACPSQNVEVMAYAQLDAAPAGAAVSGGAACLHNLRVAASQESQQLRQACGRGSVVRSRGARPGTSPADADVDAALPHACAGLGDSVVACPLLEQPAR
jgi:hypothetical protein